MSRGDLAGQAPLLGERQAVGLDRFKLTPEIPQALGALLVNQCVAKLVPPRFNDHVEQLQRFTGDPWPVRAMQLVGLDPCVL